jgi:hypothetical protein
MAMVSKQLKIRLRCFVAIAFDNSDTDAIYKCIARTLKGMQITPIRIDRVEHNDDIDDRIIEEIESADFALADLTYARPSVYFEAGYAQRVIPVIYTARHDHFRPSADDPSGNLRVHFDLQMRNIIRWISGADAIFADRLTKRVTKVIAPILHQKQIEITQKQKIADFEGLSVQDKRRLLIGIAEKHFRKAGYKVTQLTSDDKSRKFPYSPAPAPFRGGIAAVKQRPNELHFVVAHTTLSITKGLSDLYMLLMNRLPLYGKDMFAEPGAPKRVLEDTVICSFGSGGLTRLHKNISHLRAGDADHTLTTDRPLLIHRHGGNTEVPRQSVFHVVESKSRLLALGETLSERFE